MTFESDRTCPGCGAVISAREQLSAFDRFVLHVVEVIICPKCGTEVPNA